MVSEFNLNGQINSTMHSKQKFSRQYDEYTISNGTRKTVGAKMTFFEWQIGPL